MSDTPANRPSPAVSADVTRRAARRGWDRDADSYQAAHGTYLGGTSGIGFVWCPEGLDEADVALLGRVNGRRVAEIGCGAAQCARWLTTQGAEVVAIDLSAGQLRHARTLSTNAGVNVPLLQADACSIPLQSSSVDLAASAYGAIPFINDLDAVFGEVARILRPGGRWVFSVTHPIRWAFPDDGGSAGLTVTGTYFDRTPYVEFDAHGEPVYIEHHHTIGDYVHALGATGFLIRELLEPAWPAELDRSWDSWTPLRGRAIPGTAIFSSELRQP